MLDKFSTLCDLCDIVLDDCIKERDKATGANKTRLRKASRKLDSALTLLTAAEDLIKELE
jgi:hypothetical protein